MKNMFEKIKNDKDFRYDFFIALWSGIIILAVVVALIYGVVHFTGKMNSNTDNAQATEKPVESASPSPQPTPFVTPDAGIDNDDDNNDNDNNNNDDDNGENHSNDDEEDKKDTPPSSETVYATTTVNVRKEASTSSQSLGKLTEGASVERIESLSNGWSKVTYEGKTAYIKSEYLTTKPADNKTAAPRTSTPSSNNNRPKATKAPVSAEKTSKPKATKTPKQKDDESSATSVPSSSEPTSVPPVSDNLTGTDIQNYTNAPANTAKPDGASD